MTNSLSSEVPFSPPWASAAADIFPALRHLLPVPLHKVKAVFILGLLRFLIPIDRYNRLSSHRAGAWETADLRNIS